MDRTWLGCVSFVAEFECDHHIFHEYKLPQQLFLRHVHWSSTCKGQESLVHRLFFVKTEILFAKTSLQTTNATTN